MRIDKKLFRVETMRGTGNGGQHRNKTDSAVRITHLPTGITAYADERSQNHSKKLAWSQIQERLRNRRREELAEKKKVRRDEAIRPKKHIRTYDYKSGVVKDHRTKKAASIKDVVGKGKIDLLR